MVAAAGADHHDDGVGRGGRQQHHGRVLRGLRQSPHARRIAAGAALPRVRSWGILSTERYVNDPSIIID